MILLLIYIIDTKNKLNYYKISDSYICFFLLFCFSFLKKLFLL
ncbi:hypothetical Protein pso3_02710 [Candidatus Phytoplasma solani]